MKPIVLPLIAAAALAAGPALAGLHKCTTKEGKTIYTEFECEGDAKKADVTIRDSSGFDGTKVPPAKSDGAAGAAKSGGTTPGAAPSKGPPARDPVAEAMERVRLANEKARQESEKAKQENK
jgi:hypothetical protein